MTPDQRTAWLADVSAILSAYETHPELPEPCITAATAGFYLTATSGPAARRELNAAETALTEALGIAFTDTTEDSEPGDAWYYHLTGEMPGGLKVVIRAVTGEAAGQDESEAAQ